jgi:hypothetical protein
MRIDVHALITHGIPSRYPRIKIINSHLGGVLPIDSLGAGRLLLGTDFPYEAGDVFVRAIDYITDPHITQDEANAILEGNAAALFGISTPTSGPAA